MDGRKFKRFLAVILAVSMLLCLFDPAAQAAGGGNAVAVSDGGTVSSAHPICRRLYEEKKFPIAIH